MKIIDFKTILVNNVPPYNGGRHWMFIKLVTDAGIEGIGERALHPLKNIEAQVKLVETLVQEFVIGKSPFDIELLWQQMYATHHDYRHPSLDYTPAIGAIELACWDAIGKYLNQPVYNLLGGQVRDKLRAYAYMPSEGIWEAPEKAGEVAKEMVAQGNSACKYDPFPFQPQPRDIPLEQIYHVRRIFQSIRDAVGEKLEIGIGTHGQFTTYTAIRIAKALEEFFPFWFEEPVPPENIEELARVAAHISIPIAAGERLATKYEFQKLLEKQAAQIIQMDVVQCGGILEAKKIAGMADAHYALIAPHMYCGPVAAAAAIQLDICTPNFLIQEFNFGPLHNQILKNPARFENGFLIPSTSPGLGVEFDENVLAGHQFVLKSG